MEISKSLQLESIIGLLYLFQLLERAGMSFVHAGAHQILLSLHWPFVVKNVGRRDELVCDLTLQMRALRGFVS